MAFCEIKLEDVIDNLKFSTVAKSPIHGHGLFASAPLSAGTVLGNLDGQVVPWDLHKKYELTLEWNALDEKTLLVRAYRTKYSFINHCREPNLFLARDPLRVVLQKDTAIGEELTLDYRLEPLPPEYVNGVGRSYL